MGAPSSPHHPPGSPSCRSVLTALHPTYAGGGHCDERVGLPSTPRASGPTCNLENRKISRINEKQQTAPKLPRPWSQRWWVADVGGTTQVCSHQPRVWSKGHGSCQYQNGREETQCGRTA